MKTIIKTYRLAVLVFSILILNQVAYGQLCDITPSKFKGCLGDDINFQIITPPSSYYAIKWSFGDGDSSNQKVSSINHKYDSMGTYNVCVTLYSDAAGTIKCGPKCITIHIYDRPNADFVLPKPSTQCFKGNSFQFMDASTPGKNKAPINIRSWDFGDGGKSIATNPLYSYAASGAYTIFLQIADTNGCTDTAQKVASIIVLPDLAPKFKTAYKISCPVTPVKFNNLSDSNGKCVASWWWDFGDGSGDSTSSNWDTQFSHIYHSDGAFTPRLYVKSCYGCVDSFVFPAGARNIFYWFDIKKSASGPVCWEGNNICFGQKPRPNAYYWLWNFDDPPSQNLNTDDKTWTPCHAYTSPGFFHITLRIWEPNCIRDTTFCSFIPLMGPQAMIKLPPPAKNSKCEAGKRIPIGVFEAAYSKCLNPKDDPVAYTYPIKVTPKFVTRTDSFYCNAPLGLVDSVLKTGCTDTVVKKINYRLRYAQGATKYYDSINWMAGSWYAGDPYPWVTNPARKVLYYPPVGGCNYKNIHDSDQYKIDCREPNWVFFPNNSIKYRLRYDIDNDANKFSIPPGKDASMDKCRNPSYPWASDSMQHFWDFSDSYGDDCTSTVAKPNVKCKYSTEIAPIHLYSKTGCYSPKLTVTDTVTKCVSQANVTIPMEPPDAGWDYKVFKSLAMVGFDTSERKLDWNLQLQMPAEWGRRGVILRGTPCVGQLYDQKVDLKETMPSCGRQKWWVVFDSAADCRGFCKDSFWVDTTGGNAKNKLIKVKAIQCSWIDDDTYNMMGQKYNYSKGGCKTMGIIIKTGDCIDTFWYNQYKYIADVQPYFDILDPKSFNVNTGAYQRTLNYGEGQQYKLCAPFQLILTVKDTVQTGIMDFKYTISKNFSAPWTKAWKTSLEDSCIKVQTYSYMLCQKDSFFVNKTVTPYDTTWTSCFMFPNPFLNCGVNQQGNVSINYFLGKGYLKKATYPLLSLDDTLVVQDSLGNSLFEPGRYSITSVIRNVYNCYNFAQGVVHVGYYTDFDATDQIICYEGGGDTVVFQADVQYFYVKNFPSDPDLDSRPYFRDPLNAGDRGGMAPAAPSMPEKVEWAFNGDGIYGDGLTGVPDSVFFVYTQPGNYTISLKTTDSNGCEQILKREKYIKVIGVVADFDTASGVSVCAPQTVQFVDKSYGLNVYEYIYNKQGQKIDSIAVDTVVAWKWNFGDNLGGNRSESYLKNPIHTYRNNGCFTVTLIVRMGNGCIDTVTKFEYVCIIGPKPEFDVLDTLSCVPFTVFVKDKSDRTSSWEFIKGDNTTGSFTVRKNDSIFALIYTKAGTYKLYLRASDSVYNPAVGKYITCTSEYGEASDSLDSHFTIYVKPIKLSQFEGDTIICSDDIAEFDNSKNTNPIYDTASWNWGDSSNLELQPIGKVTHKYTLPENVYNKTYKVEMNALLPADSCPDAQKYRNITVVKVKAGLALDSLSKPLFYFYDKSQGGNDRKRQITIKDINDTTYFHIYNHSTTPGDHLYDSIVTHNFMNRKGDFEVCEITWVEVNGLPRTCKKMVCDTVNNDYIVKIEIPNVFTPGGNDTINSRFVIKSLFAEKWDLTIMNRWGEKVFKSTDANDHWNGKRNNNGAECAAGVYYFIINYQLRGQGEKTASGSVTLIR